MDSRDPRPPHLPHHHHPQPPPPSHPGVFLGQAQQHLQNNSYGLPNNNSMNSATSAAAHTGLMHHQHQQNPGFPFNSMPVGGGGAAPKPMDHLQQLQQQQQQQQQQPDVSGSSGGLGSSGLGSSGLGIEPARKKRGRPRKYSPDNSIGLGLSPAPVTQVPSLVPSNDSVGGGGGSSETPAKKHRGRPPGSVKRQLDALGAPGVGFTPHVITVNAGEDIASKIMAFSQQGPRTVCILSANGAICNVTLRQPAMSGGTVTYEGRFEIISLTGSFLLSETSGGRSRSGTLSVSLAGSDGRVLGGGVAGMLKAASPVQVVVGSFIADGKKSKSGPSSTPPPPSNMLNFGGTGPGTSPSPGDSSDSGEENDDTSPNHGPGLYGQPGQSMPMYSSMGWQNSMKVLPN